ncbi:hypothetical protein AB0D35_06325 [Streptomyces sp. NPDC048301]|uniref:hypothetical protein n=1 Tax=Streptomyces sp. NPDC048301 TaxID=3155631 RepID=UPI00342F71A8
MSEVEPVGHPRDGKSAGVAARPRVNVHTRMEMNAAVASWLLCAAEDRKTARQGWERDGLALIRCGSLFSAVRIPGEFIRAAAGVDLKGGWEEAPRVDAFLASALEDGPVIADWYAGQYYALVPASEGRHWYGRGTAFLGAASYLGVPRPDVDEPGLARSYWSVPMESPGALCCPDALQAFALNAKALAGARRRELEADRER